MASDEPFSHRTAWDRQPNRLSHAIEVRRASGQELLDLTESNPTRCGFEYDTEVLQRALSDPRGLAYEPHPFGLPRAREAVARYYASRNAAVPPEQVALTSGSSESYGHLFRLLADTGDRVLAPAPSYPLFDFLARLHDIEVCPYRLEYHGRWEIDFGSLEAARTPRTRAVIVVNPNNPTGSLVTTEARARLAGWCRERGLALIADEVFLDYRWPEATPGAGTFASGNEALTFTLNGLSKTAALPQLKLGWIVTSGPAGLVQEAQARLEIILDTYLSVGTPVQQALPELLGTCEARQHLVRQRVLGNLECLDALLRQQALCSRLAVEAGWSVVLRVPRIRSDEEWALEFIEQDGMLVYPGHFFEFPAEGHLVLSLIAPEAIFQNGVIRLLRRVAARSADCA